MTQSITIELPDISLARIQKFAEHFGCRAFKTKIRYQYRIEADDVMCFYWLGANISNSMLNQLTNGPLSKYIEL